MPLFALIGNTTVRIAADTAAPASFPADASAEELAAFLSDFPGSLPVAASVNPSAENTLLTACSAAGLPVPLFAGRDFPTRVRLDVATPSAVGIDRILNVKAVFARSGTACAVADFGTALSISVAGADGAFLGGAILPGITLSLRALADGAASLPRVQPAPPAAALGRDTSPAMLSGVVFGALGAVREILSRISREVSLPLAVFVTGGAAPLIRPHLPPDWTVVPALTLEGLRLAYRESL